VIKLWALFLFFEKSQKEYEKKAKASFVFTRKESLPFIVFTKEGDLRT